MKILYCGNVPAPYTIDFLNELSKLCNVTAVFERKKSRERVGNWSQSKSVRFDMIILKGINYNNDSAFSPQVIYYIKRSLYDYIIVGNPLTMTGIFSIMHMKFLKINYGIISEGGFAKDKKNLKEYLKYLILRRASFYLSGSKPGDDYFIKYGAKKENVFSYPFSSLFKKDILFKPMKQSEKNLVKNKMGLEISKEIIISVGRVIPSKGFDTLVKVAKGFPEKIFIIIGGKPTDEINQIMIINQIDNVRFINHLEPVDLINFYKLADLFILPTRSDTYGLVINEAMSYGLPIITTFNCVAGIHLIEQGVNGYLVKSDDLSDLADKIKKISEDDKLKKEMTINNLEKINNHHFTEMAHVIFNALKKISNKDN